MKIPATIFMPITTPQQRLGKFAFFRWRVRDNQVGWGYFDASAKAAQNLH